MEVHGVFLVLGGVAFPHHFYSAWICSISAIVILVFCSSDKEAASSARWWLFHGSGVAPSPLRAAVLLSTACKLGAVRFGFPSADDCLLHLSRDGVQEMCLTDDASGLSCEFRTIW